MLVLISYDVNTASEGGQKRLRQVAKECQNYGQRVQNSVFECLLTEAQYVQLKATLEHIVDMKNDSILFYLLGKNWKRNVIRVGKKTSYDATEALVI